MTITLSNGMKVNPKQQMKIIKELRILGNEEEADLLNEGNLWEEDFISDLVEDMKEEGIL